MPDQVIQPKGTFSWKRFLPVFSICVILIVLAGIALYGCRTEITPIPKTDIKSIRVVIDNNYPPYSFIGANGTLTGISIDQWKLWEQKTGVKVEITGMNWSDALVAMQEGQFDVIDTIFYNETRAQIYDFSPSYATIDVPIYFNNNISGITDASSARGFTVAVKSGDAVIDILRNSGVQNLAYYDNYQSIIEAANNGDVTVFAIDKPPADYFLYQYGIQSDYNSTAPLYSGQFHRAVKKGNTDLLSLLNAGFSNISSDEYKAIDQKYFGSPVLNVTAIKYSVYIIAAILFVFLVLLGWNRALQVNVNKKTKTLQESETRFRGLFEESPVSLWVEDMSDAIDYMSLLRNQYGDDLRAHLIGHPDEIERCFEKVHVLDVNKATLELFKAESKAQMLGNLIPIMKGTPDEVLADELIQIADKNPSFTWEGTNTTYSGEKLVANIRWVAEPGHEEKLDRVILSLVDMTAVRNAEQEVRQVHNRLDMAIKAASLGVYEYDVATGEVIWDDRMYELYSKQAGKFTPTHEEWLKCIVPADRKKAKERVQQVLRKEAEFENTYRIYSEGHGIRYIKAFGEVVWDKDGSPLKMVGINFDITKIMETEKNRTTVSDIQLKIAHAESTEEVYQIVASGVHTLVGTGIVWVTAVNEGNEYLQVKSIALELAEKRKLDKELNLHIEDETFLLSDMPADDLQLFRSGKFERYPRGLGQLSTWKISKEACRVIEDRLNYKYIYKMGFVTEGKHLGGVTILSKRDLTDLSGSIETVMNLTTLALNRITSEQALHKSEEQLRSSFEQSPIGIATSDIEFKFTSANMAFCRMIGYLEKEIIGRTFKELTHPDDLEASKKFMKKLSAAEIDQFSLEKRYLKSDKTVIWGATTVKAIHDKSGKVVSYLVMVQDITDRKLSEALLSEERQKIKVLMDSIPDSVYFKDLNNRFTNANLATARKFGLVNPAELIGKSDHDFFAEEIANQADAEEYEIIHFGMPIVGREELEIWPNKPTRWVSKTKMALYDEQGAVAGTFGVIRDITERKLQEEEIRRLNADLEKKVENRTRELRLKNQELEAFTYTVSHDLKAPLRGISGYADILLQDHSDHLDEEGKGFLTKLIRSSHQLSQLIEDLLTYSRLERRPVIYTEIQVKDIVETALEQRGQEISERKVMIHTDLDEGVIKSSHELLTQIIGNYFDNALKFTRKQPLPEIWISYKEHGKTGLLSIRDNGIGFDAKYSEKIFEVFQRLQIDDMFPGTGIGLALVKKAAELLEYRVWAKGVPEKGATFNLEVIK